MFQSFKTRIIQLLSRRSIRVALHITHILALLFIDRAPVSATVAMLQLILYLMR